MSLLKPVQITQISTRCTSFHIMNAVVFSWLSKSGSNSTDILQGRLKPEQSQSQTTSW